MKIAIVGGNGKMGRLIAQKLEHENEIYVVDKGDSLDILKRIDLVIDFANANSSVQSARFCYQNKVPLIVGSTGQTQAQFDEILKLSEVAAVVVASNFSKGIAIVKSLIEQVLSKVKSADICIFEKHHKQKLDSPSGTAKELKNLLESKGCKSVCVLSERGGKEIGTHKVDVYFDDELISISHQAFSRDAFASGVVLAVERMKTINSPGVYSFDDFVQNSQRKNLEKIKL